MKAFNKAAIFILLLLWSASSISLCPEKGTSFLKNKDLTLSSINNPISTDLNVYFELVKQANEAILKRHKVTDQAALTVDLALESIQFTVPKDSEIVSSSESANCVAIYAGGKITTYLTSTGKFELGQQFADATYSKKSISYYLADDCSLVRRVQVDGKGAKNVKWFKASAQTTSITFPPEISSDQQFQYVVDTQRNLFTLQKSGVYIKNPYQQLKVEPVQVKWSEALQAVITVTKYIDIYSIVIIDPKLDSVLYNASFSAELNYTTTLNFLIKDEQVSILLTDSKGFVSFIQLQRQKNTIKETVYTLGSSVLPALFAPTSIISVSNKIIFVYASKRMTYLEAVDRSIKLLKAFDTDIEQNSFKYRTQTLKTQEPKAIFSLIAPNLLSICNIAGADGVSADVLSTPQLPIPKVIDLKTGAISKCPHNCLTCQSPAKCTTCLTGYALIKTSGKCVPCKGCLSCSESDPKVCYSCFAPQYLDKTKNTCVSPTCIIDKCLQCDSAGACSTCLSGYGLIAEKCVKCQVKGCKSCSTDAKTCDANACKLGSVYYLDPKTKTGSCQPCAVGINTCLTTDLSAAVSCATGFYISKDSTGVNRCSKCLTNCRECIDGVSCAKCVKDYLPSTDGKKCVLKCSDNCLTCDANNATKCLTCFTGSQLNTTTTKCVSDPTCNQTSSCTFCNDGFVLNNGQCVQCKYTDTNCTSCLTSDVATCASCKFGFYLTENTCKACQAGCGNCVGASSCVTCNDGFYIVAYQNKDIGTCFECDTSCKTCSGAPTICTSCDENSTLQGSKCISNKNVAISFVIQANVNNFVQFMNELQSWFLTVSNSGKQESADTVEENEVAILKTQKFGSSIVDAQVSADSNGNANAISNTFNAAISQTPSIGGYQVISGSASVQTDAPDPVYPEEKSNLGLILGLSIPLGLLAIIALIIISIKLHQRSKSMPKNYYNDNNRNTSDHIGRSNDRIEARI